METKPKAHDFFVALLSWLALDSLLTWVITLIFPEQFDNGDAVFWLWFASIWLATIFAIVFLRRKKNIWASNGIISAVFVNFGLWILLDILGVIGLEPHYYLDAAIMPSPVFIIYMLFG